MFHHGNLQGFKLFLRVQTFKTPTPFRRRCGVSSSISALKTLVSYPLRPSLSFPLAEPQADLIALFLGHRGLRG